MGVVDEARQKAIVDAFISRLAIKTSSVDQKIRELSGGNQQKVLLARWLCTDPKLLILDEPTRGIDVGAKAEIQALIRELANQGLGVLMISSELEEIVEGADRVFVLSDGRTVADLKHAEANAHAIMAAMAHEGPLTSPGGEVDEATSVSRPGLTLGLLWTLVRRYAALAALIVLLVFNFAVTPHFAQLSNAQRQSDPSGDHRHRVGGNDSGDFDRRHRPLRRFADGDRGRSRAHHFPQPLRPSARSARRYPGVYRPRRGRGRVRGLQRLVHNALSRPTDVGTLVLFIAGRGIGQVLTNGNLQVFKNPPFQFIGLGRVFGVPCQVIVMLILVAIAAWVVKRTLFGRQILAIGGNERAARLSGVPVDRVKRWVYAISGLLRRYRGAGRRLDQFVERCQPGWPGHGARRDRRGVGRRHAVSLGARPISSAR